MSTQADSYQRRRFTAEEHNRLLEEGILSPSEGTILHDGFVVIPLEPERRMGANPDPGPADAQDPSDALLMEPPSASRTSLEASEIMNAFTVETRELALRKFTVDEYHRMGEIGVLSPDERTELLEGEIIVMAAIGNKHAFCVDFFTDVLTIPTVKEHALVRVQNAIFLDDRSQVQPDISLARRRSYADGIPRPEDILLLIEVADSTIGEDRREKIPLYARHGIPEAWLADVNARAVDIHTDPIDGVYTNVRRVELDGTLAPTAFPEVVISVRDVFQW